MQRTLFIIPHSIAGFPVFGFGWVFFLLLAAGIGYALWAMRHPQRREELQSSWLGWAIMLAVVAFVVPKIEVLSLSGRPLGVAVRGYGLFLLLGVVSGVWLAMVRARRAGFNPDLILQLSLWLVVGGLVGARTFYVVQYFEQFQKPSLAASIQSILTFTNGGMVVYGSMIGGVLAGALFCWRYAVPFLRLGDVAIPCLFLGVALGRLGCLMNGCCWGDRCEPHWSALRFPPGSPVYDDQIASGQILGLTLDREPTMANPAEIQEVLTDSPAAEQGLRAGDRVLRIQAFPAVPQEQEERVAIDDVRQVGVLAETNRGVFTWQPEDLPSRSLPVLPTQPISSLGAFILTGLLLLVSRWIARPGLLLGIGFAAYACLRFGEELLRVDEAGQFGTDLSIGQWVSLVVLIVAAILIAWSLVRKPTGDASAG